MILVPGNPLFIERKLFDKISKLPTKSCAEKQKCLKKKTTGKIQKNVQIWEKTQENHNK